MAAAGTAGVQTLSTFVHYPKSKQEETDMYWMHSFQPSYRTIDKIDALPLASVLRKERQFYQSSMEFVWDNGGPIAKEFIDKLPFLAHDNVLVDVRVHSLQAGYYPAIPGYHLDWLPRTNKGADPIVSTIPDYEHVVLIVAESSLTEFVADATMIALPDTKAFEHANRQIKESKVKTEHVTSGDMVLFTSRDWHRPSPALGNEWRLLIRASRIDHKKPVNRIVEQSQVYIPIEEASW